MVLIACPVMVLSVGPGMVVSACPCMVVSAGPGIIALGYDATY